MNLNEETFVVVAFITFFILSTHKYIKTRAKKAAFIFEYEIKTINIRIL